MSRHTHRARRGSLFRRREGTAAVELALISPMLLILLAGIIDFGRVYREEIELSAAVAAAAQYALINTSSINSTSATSLAATLQQFSF
jgi:Flp pilus assembly protein TadG